MAKLAAASRVYRQRYVPRRDMPQVDPCDVTALVEYLAFKGVSVTDCERSPDSLTFRQHVDYQPERMNAQALADPILVASDGCILDGNHRAYGCRLAGMRRERCLQLGLPFPQAIKALFSFAGTYVHPDATE